MSGAVVGGGLALILLLGLGVGVYFLVTNNDENNDNNNNEVIIDDPLLPDPPGFDNITESDPGKPPEIPPIVVPEVGNVQETTRFFSAILNTDPTRFFAPLPLLTAIDGDGNGINTCLPDVATLSLEVSATCQTEVTVGTTETLALPQITDTSDLSVTLTFEEEGNASNQVTFPIVHGSPYLTAAYASSVPSLSFADTIVAISSDLNAITSFEVTAERAEGNRTWCVFTSQPLSWTQVGDNMQASEAFEGDLRVAVCTDESREAIRKHNATIPVSGTSVLSFEDNSGTVALLFQTRGGERDNLLMMALPHHFALELDLPTESSVTFGSIRGNMVGVVGGTWTLSLNLTTTSFDSLFPVNTFSQTLFETIALDSTFDPGPIPTADSDVTGTSFVEFSENVLREHGLRLFALSRLVLIADLMEQTDTVEVLTGVLTERLTEWFDQDSSPLRYDTEWGGIVDSFKNDTYSNHHIDYGYLIYAASVLSKVNATWGNEFESSVIDLVRDIANPSAEDTFFPRFRTMDWYMGHSWGVGVEEDKQQEHGSVSEACNSWYAVALFGEQRGNQEIEFVGKIMLAMEQTAAHFYYQILPDSEIYADPFRSGAVVGVLGDVRAAFESEFGSESDFVYLSQMLPFTPISHEVLNPDWQSVAVALLIDNFQGNWDSLFVASQALVEAEATLLDEAQVVTDFSNHTLLSDLVYWILTQPLDSDNKGSIFGQEEAGDLAFVPFSFPESFCEETSNTAAIKVKGAGGDDRNHAVFSFGERAFLGFDTEKGINVLLLDGTTLTLSEARNFDTSADPAASSELVTFVESAPDDSVLLLAVQNEAADQLDVSVPNLLASLGAQEIFGLSFEDSYSLIIAKDASGATVESRSPVLEDAAVSSSFVPCDRSLVPDDLACNPSAFVASVSPLARLSLSGLELLGSGNREESALAAAFLDTDTKRIVELALFADAGESTTFASTFSSLPSGTPLILTMRQGGNSLVSSEFSDLLVSLGSLEVGSLDSDSVFVAAFIQGEGLVAEERGVCVGDDCPTVEISGTFECISPTASPSPSPSVSPSTSPSVSLSPIPNNNEDEGPDVPVLVGAVIGSLVGAVAIFAVFIKRRKLGEKRGYGKPVATAVPAGRQETQGSLGGGKGEKESAAKLSNASISADDNDEEEGPALSMDAQHYLRLCSDARKALGEGLDLEEKGDAKAAIARYNNARLFALDAIALPVNDNDVEALGEQVQEGRKLLAMAETRKEELSS